MDERIITLIDANFNTEHLGIVLFSDGFEATNVILLCDFNVYVYQFEGVVYVVDKSDRLISTIYQVDTDKLIFYLGYRLLSLYNMEQEE